MLDFRLARARKRRDVSAGRFESEAITGYRRGLIRARLTLDGSTEVVQAVLRDIDVVHPDPEDDLGLVE